jgi:hypothetical protein
MFIKDGPDIGMLFRKVHDLFTDEVMARAHNLRSPNAVSIEVGGTD